ncbi:MAG: hypothetical protein ACI9U5_001094 [Colwellia sp.]
MPIDAFDVVFVSYWWCCSWSLPVLKNLNLKNRRSLFS